MTDSPTERLGHAIRAHRAHQGMRQVDAAKKGGLSEGAWRNAESGEIAPQPRTLARIDRALGWPPGTAGRVLAGEDPPEIQPPKEPDGDGYVVLRGGGHIRLIRATEGLPPERIDELVEIAEMYRRRAESE